MVSLAMSASSCVQWSVHDYEQPGKSSVRGTTSPHVWHTLKGGGFVIVVGRRVDGHGDGGRHRAFRAAHELDPLAHDLRYRALLAVLPRPVTSLQPPLDKDLAALVEIFDTALDLLAAHQ